MQKQVTSYPVPVCVYMDLTRPYMDFNRILQNRGFIFYPTSSSKVSYSGETLGEGSYIDKMKNPHWVRKVPIPKLTLPEEPEVLFLTQKIRKKEFAYDVNKNASPSLKISDFRAMVLLDSVKHTPITDDAWDIDKEFYNNTNPNHEKLALKSLRDLSIELESLFVVKRLAPWVEIVRDLATISPYVLMNEEKMLRDGTPEKEAYEGELSRRWLRNEID